MTDKKKRIRAIMPLLHIALALIYEFVFFKKGPYPYEPLKEVRRALLSPEGERLVFFLLSKTAGCILILLIWHVLTEIYKNKRKSTAVILLAAAVFALFIYPYNYLLEDDNLTLYMASIHYYPDYWQSYLTGIVYNACLMVFPHSAAIPVLQNCFFVGGLLFLSRKSGMRWGKRAAFLPWLLLLLPETYEIGLNPYRNAFYTIFCIWFLSFLFFDLLQDQKPVWQKKAAVLACAACLVVMRSEGLLLVPVILALCMTVWDMGWKRKILWCCIFGLLCATVALPQKIGNEKYFGKDYQLVNYMNVLKDIFRDPECNLTYDGAGEDLQQIAAVTDVGLIRYGGLDAYRNHNYETRGTINQSCLTIREQKEFIAAANRLIFHNCRIFFRNRMLCFAAANGAMDTQQDVWLPDALDEEWETKMTAWGNELSNQLMDRIGTGMTVIVSSPGGLAWYNNGIRNRVADAVMLLVEIANYVFRQWRIGFTIRCLSVFLLLVMEGRLIQKQGLRKNLICHITALMLFGLWFGVALCSPASRSVYYYPVYYMTLIWGMCITGLHAELERAEKEDKTEGKNLAL